MLKKCGRSFISLLLVFLLTASVFTVAGSAATNQYLRGWTASTTKTLTINGKGITVKNAKATTKYATGTDYGLLTLNSGTPTGSVDITVKTNSKTSQEMSFELYVPLGYVMQFDYRIDSTSNCSAYEQYYKFAPQGSGENTYNLEDGNSYIVVGSGTSSAPNRAYFYFNLSNVGSSKTFKVHLDNIHLVPAEDVSITVKKPTHGSLSVGDTPVTANYSTTVSTSVGVSLEASPDTGYVFAGYKINDGTTVVAPSGTSYNFFPTATGDTIEAVFVDASEPHLLVGNMNGFTLESNLRDAINSAVDHNFHYIIPITDVTVTDDGDEYDIPNGVTLVVPNDSEHNIYTEEPNLLYSASGGAYRTTRPSRATTLAKVGATRPYVTLTLNADVVLNIESGAALSVGGMQWSPNGGGAACVKGGYGLIVVNEEAKINIASGAALYAWGFIVSANPAGSTADSNVLVECDADSKVYEMFQITDYSGGSIISDIVGSDTDMVFPFSQYYVQNIECKMQLNAGASEKVCGALTVSGNAVSTGVQFIGPDDALFILNSGYAIKYYDTAQDKLICRLDGNADAQISCMSLNVGVDLDTIKYQLPISNIGVEVAGGSYVEINQDLQVWPDSYVLVEDGCSLDVNANIFVVDKATTAGHVMGNKSVSPLVYSATLAAQNNGDGASHRTASSLAEPRVVNNGEVNINLTERADGTLVGSMNLVGEGGTLTGSGTIVNNAADEVVVPDAKLITFYQDPDKGRLAGKPADNLPEPDAQCDDLEAVGMAYSYDSVYDLWHTDEVTVFFIDSENDENNSEETVAYGGTVTAPLLTSDTAAFDKWINDNNIEETYRAGEEITARTFMTFVASWSELPVEIDDPSHSLSLEGQIHVNFYWPLAASEDPADYTYTFTCMGKTTDPYPLPAAPDENGFGYKTSFAVNAPEMTSDITAKLYNNGVLVKEDTFKAAEYARAYAEEYTASDTELTDNTAYLIGKINGSVNWNEANPRYKFVDNPDNSDELMLENVALSAGDQIKVAKYYSGTQSYGIYPDGTDNHYTISQNGTYNIYFKKNPDGYVDGWHYGKFYVETVSTDTGVYQSMILPTLLQAAMNYGSKAQVKFGVNTNDLADSNTYLAHQGVFTEVNQAMINVRLGDAETKDVRTSMDQFSAYGLEYYGASLVMNSSTKIKLYYGIQNANLYNTYKNSFMCGDTSITATKVSSDLVCFEIDNVAAADLDTRYTIYNTANTELTVQYAALDYVSQCLEDKTANPVLFNLTQSLYWYNIFADAYFVA